MKFLIFVATFLVYHIIGSNFFPVDENNVLQAPNWYVYFGLFLSAITTYLFTKLKKRKSLKKSEPLEEDQIYSEIYKSQGKSTEEKTEDSVYYSLVSCQDSSQSVIDEHGRYDLQHFSEHEADFIKRILLEVDRKYPEEYRSMGLANESYVVTYKPRYVLFDIVILRYENSADPIDMMAVALAYESKGAHFRQEAIFYFEKAIQSVDKCVFSQFSSYTLDQIYLKFAELYEKEHQYKQAIYYFELAKSSGKLEKEYIDQRITKIREKIANPPRTRKSKKPDYYDEFEKNVRRAAIAFDSGDFSGLDINAKPNGPKYD